MGTISSANIACGYHAGDPAVTVKWPIFRPGRGSAERMLNVN